MSAGNEVKEEIQHNTTTGEDTTTGSRLIIKQTPNNQSLKNGQKVLAKKSRFIAPKDLVLTNSTCHDLL